MKNIIRKSLLALVTSMLISAAVGGELVNVAGASGIALSGYDPVAFFTEHKAVNGDPGITAKHDGASFLFASKSNRKLFNRNPEKYAPQYGGFCAFGASVNALFPVDISTWQIRNGKLYLNLNQEILKAFNKDLNGAIAKANKNWPKLEKKYSK